MQAWHKIYYFLVPWINTKNSWPPPIAKSEYRSLVVRMEIPLYISVAYRGGNRIFPGGGGTDMNWPKILRSYSVKIHKFESQGGERRPPPLESAPGGLVVNKFVWIKYICLHESEMWIYYGWRRCLVLSSQYINDDAGAQYGRHNILMMTPTPGNCRHNILLMTPAPGKCRHNISLVTPAPGNCRHNILLVTPAPGNCRP